MAKSLGRFQLCKSQFSNRSRKRRLVLSIEGHPCRCFDLPRLQPQLVLRKPSQRMRNCRPPFIKLVNVLVCDEERPERIQPADKAMPPSQLRAIARTAHQVGGNAPTTWRT